MFCSFPNGCAKMKSSDNVSDTLNEMLNKEELLADVRDELNMIINNLKPIEKPKPVRLKGSFFSYARIRLKCNYFSNCILLKFKLMDQQRLFVNGTR
jgi:hypothetical protein